METESSDVHLNFFKESTHIEVHMLITKEHYFYEIPILEEEIWHHYLLKSLLMMEIIKIIV